MSHQTALLAWASQKRWQNEVVMSAGGTTHRGRTGSPANQTGVMRSRLLRADGGVRPMVGHLTHKNRGCQAHLPLWRPGAVFLPGGPGARLP